MSFSMDCSLPGVGLVVLIFTGCAANVPARYSAADHVPAELQLGNSEMVLSESQIDTLNRYLSTVRVTTAFMIPGEGTNMVTCSGVLIHPRVVLTAGHCVCRSQNVLDAAQAAIIDKSTCGTSSAVTVTRYPAAVRSLDEGPIELQASEEGPYRGSVQVHEDILITYRLGELGERELESSRADLAVIVLQKSMKGLVEPVKLAPSPVQLMERVILAGYGAADLAGGLVGRHRRHGENEVASIKTDGSTFYVGRKLEIEPFYRGEKPGLVRRKGSYTAGGDSGGPCFRERRGSLELVGIAKSTQGPPVSLSTYTSTYAYLGWLRDKIAAVDREKN